MSTVPARPLPPVTVCACSSGCGCAPGSPGCGHYGCRGAAPLSCMAGAVRAAQYAEDLAARRRTRAVYDARRTAWHSSAPSAP